MNGEPEVTEEVRPTRASRAARALRRERRRAPGLVALLVALAAVVAVGTTVDRRGRGAVADAAPTAPTTTVEGDPEALAPVAARPGSLGSTWFCAGGTARDEGSADHRIVVVNPGEADLRATVTVYGGAFAGDASAAVSDPVTEQLDLPARGRVALRLADVLEAQFAAAVVEVAGGEVVVEHVVRGEDDLEAAPCASRPSTQWHFAAGSTTRDARQRLALFNPFPDDAVVDVHVTTPEGLRSPEALAGFVVPAGRLVAVDLCAVDVCRHEQVAASIVARSGRLVVDRIQTFDGSDGPAGLAVTAGAPAPALVWHLPDGFKTDGLTETVTVYNPGEVQAEVDVEVVTDPPEDGAVVTAVEPFELSIGPRRYAQVQLHAEDRVPAGVGHSVVVRSQNGVPVVAERWIRSADPAPRTGLAATLGSPVVATRWLGATGGTGDGESMFLVVTNPSAASIARVSVATPAVTQLLPVEGLQDVEVPPGGRLRIDLGRHVNRETLPVVVTASQPVVVERGSYPVVGGIAQAILVAGAGAEVATLDGG